jgi:hypothetical protein
MSCDDISSHAIMSLQHPQRSRFDRPRAIRRFRRLLKLFPSDFRGDFGEETFGVPPLTGRTFAPDDATDVDRATTVVVSHGLWQRRFGARPDIVGRTLLVNGRASVIIGVMPASFNVPRDAELWVPCTMRGPDMDVRAAHFLIPIARLRDDVTREQAQQDTDGIAAGLAREYPRTNTSWKLRLVPLPRRTRRQFETHAPDADWRRRARPAHRVRQRREPVPCARHEPIARARRWGHRRAQSCKPSWRRPDVSHYSAPRAVLSSALRLLERFAVCCSMSAQLIR